MYKIIIADDEALECVALEQMIAEGMNGCKVIGTVYNGLDLVREVEKAGPDIVIVDLHMPGMGGLDAIEILREKKRNLKIVIHTAYSEFSYIKRAMQYQVVNYVLKPAKREELYATLREICAQLDEVRRMEEKNVRFGQIEGEHFMASLLLGEPEPGILDSLQAELDLRYAGGVCVDIRPCDDDVARVKAVQFTEALKEAFGNETLFWSKWYRDGMYGLILQPASGMSAQNEILAVLRKTAKKLERENRQEFLIGVSRFRDVPEEFFQAVKECRQVLQGRKTAGIYLFTRSGAPGFSEAEQIFDAVEDCYWQQGLEQAISLFIGRLVTEKQEKIPFSTFKTGGILCLMHLLFEESRKNGGWYGTNLMQWDQWMALESREEMAVRLETVREILRSEETGQMSQYVALARDYMEQKYADDLSLDLVAEHAGITSFYMSRLFRKEMRANFTEILTDIRMGKVLELLWRNACSIREAGERTGYISLSYFHKVVKKYFGITAGELASLGK